MVNADLMSRNIRLVFENTHTHTCLTGSPPSHRLVCDTEPFRWNENHLRVLCHPLVRFVYHNWKRLCARPLLPALAFSRYTVDSNG